jgi:hypothetical protein
MHAIAVLVKALESDTYALSPFLTWNWTYNWRELTDPRVLCEKVAAVLLIGEASETKAKHDVLTGRLVVCLRLYSFCDRVLFLIF